MNGDVRQGRAPKEHRCLWSVERCWRYRQVGNYCLTHAKILGLMMTTPIEAPVEPLRTPNYVFEPEAPPSPKPRLNLHHVTIDGIEYEAWNH